MNQPRLYLLDAYALIFRAYFAFAKNPRITSKGLDTSAIYGFVLALLDVLEKQDPTHIAVVFDIGGSASRLEIFPEYKANRDETPDGIKVAVPIIHKFLKAMNISALGVEGFEADDVIGTLAKKAEKSGYDVFMMTPDKDFGQLVTDKIKMLRPKRGGEPAEILGPKEICEKWNISRVEQVVDVLGLMGDSADNIPGIPSVGQKTAAKLLTEYDSLEGILKNSDKIKGKLGEKVREFGDQGIMSKSLAKIIIDVPIDFNEKDLEKKEPDEIALESLLQELEFKSLSRRLLKREIELKKPKDSIKETSKPIQASQKIGQMDLFSAENSPALKPQEKPVPVQKNDYVIIDSLQSAKLLRNKLLQQDSFCFSTQVVKSEVGRNYLSGIAFSYAPNRAYYVPLGNAADEDYTDLLEFLKSPLEENSIIKIGYDLKYQKQVLRDQGVTIGGVFHDTMVMHYLLEPDKRHTIQYLFETYVKDSLGSKYLALISDDNRKRDFSLDSLPVSELLIIKSEEVDFLFQLSLILNKRIKDLNLERLYYDIEAPLINILSKMESSGVTVDIKGLFNYSKELGVDMNGLESDIHSIAGKNFNLGSPKQLGQVLFDELKIGKGKVKKTKTGQYATGEEVLEKLSKDYEVVKKLLDWRQLGKLKSTYVDSLPLLVNEKTGRIHTTFNQAVASTGRLSSTGPNLQNIPIRTTNGKKVRKSFIPRDPNHVLFSADYSQIELRVIASMSGDENMQEAFLDGDDIHTKTASKVFNVPINEVTREQRGNAKTINFGIIYGVSAFGLSQQSNLSRTEAKEVIDSYFISYPGIKKYMENQVSFARENGFVETLIGRRRYLRDINSPNRVVRGHAERNAVNAPIQGTAADIMKLAMVGVYDRMKKEGFRSKMIIQVHDELVIDTLKSELEELKVLVIEEMENAYRLDVPLEVDTGFGTNWLDAH
tara:strand:+ start:15920 stop:18742 length:2823 start_codon:yes stop_codon:yes gene_type:complete